MTMHYDNEGAAKMIQFIDLDQDSKHLLQQTNRKEAKKFIVDYIRSNKLARFEMPYLDWDSDDEQDHKEEGSPSE